MVDPPSGAIGLIEARIQPRGNSERVGGFTVTPEPRKGHAQIVVSEGIGRPETCRNFEFRRGLLVSIKLQQQFAMREPGLRKRTSLSNHLSEDTRRFIELLQLCQQHTAVVPAFRSLGPQARGLDEGERGGKTASSSQGNSAIDGLARVCLDRIRTECADGDSAAQDDGR